MRIHLLIACTLAAVAHGCTSFIGCDPDSEKFTVDATLTEADVSEILTAWGLDDRSAITCENACTHAYRRDRGWEVGSTTSCTWTLAPMAGATPDAEAGTVQCAGEGYEYFCEGRRPLGHLEVAAAIEATPGARPLGEYLARCAHLEAASIVAFEELAAALEAAGAPASLRDRCLRAAVQEREHAAKVGALARAHGCPPPPAERAAVPVTLAAIAVDNAREGCVIETWAALRAAFIAANATDPELRRLYAELAADEAEHAQLSWDLHTWLLGQVDPATREAAAGALRAAIADLPAIAAIQAAASPESLGMTPTIATRLAERYAIGLAAAA